ncbi:serine protease [Streptomyces sp. NBC_01775]|uniref:S1 family peptidase n=1 Tax=Streptomyces sp. NBC_01775 TaxID=2975939 RepID=UPI002DDAB85C|nr:serine protease [Streptomyces sp. NBC_01775]WSB75235.1 serine protease [Streptomyces sp. NBC_01775]
MSEQHWVHLYESDTYLGAGFLITPGFVLTALHCLRGLSSEEAALTLELPDGRRLPGRKCDAVKERDLALVTVEGAHGHRLAAAPRTDTPRPKVAWNCRYRPPQETAHLSGRVTHAPIAHRCVEGGELEVMQLQVDQLLGSFAGYSGGPVEAGEQERGERPVVGILLEQQLNRQDPGGRQQRPVRRDRPLRHGNLPALRRGASQSPGRRAEVRPRAVRRRHSSAPGAARQRGHPQRCRPGPGLAAAVGGERTDHRGRRRGGPGPDAQAGHRPVRGARRTRRR